MRNSTPTGLTFALPPSLGSASLRPLARHLAAVLSDIGFATIWPCKSYGDLEHALLSGEAHAGWAPPAVGAQIEASGGTLFRAVRNGGTSYRSALLCRSERSIDLKSMHAATGLSPIRAAWVDPASAAGCMMPRRYLRQRGAVLDLALDESFLGSYQACFDAVLEGDADIAASYVGRNGAGYIELCGNHAAELRVLAWTEEIPNDAVVMSPVLQGQRAGQTRRALAAAFSNPAIAAALALAFEADSFELAAAHSCQPVRLLMSEKQPRPIRSMQPAARGLMRGPTRARTCRPQRAPTAPGHGCTISANRPRRAE